jgi:hypothetical protein
MTSSMVASSIASDTTIAVGAESPVIELSSYERLEETNIRHPDYYLDDGNLVILVSVDFSH